MPNKNIIDFHDFTKVNIITNLRKYTMPKLAAIIIICLLSSVNYAKQIVCTSHEGWFDDPIITFDLNDFDGSFQLVENTVRYASPDAEPDEHTSVLADNMRCNFVNNAGFCTNKVDDDKNYNFMYQSIWVKPEFEQIVDDLLQVEAVTKPTRIYFGYQLGLKTGSKYFDFKDCEIKP